MLHFFGVPYPNANFRHAISNTIPLPKFKQIFQQSLTVLIVMITCEIVTIKNLMVDIETIAEYRQYITIYNNINTFCDNV